jgi:sulfotransferase family protein
MRHFFNRRLQKWTLRYGQLTWERRVLPDFIIIGAQKSGTSSIFFYLSQHPELAPSCKKEVHFFDGGLISRTDNFAKGEPWYRAHFPLRKNMGAHQKAFEASPSYIFNPLAPVRMHDLIPHVKIIALLRNPTDRAISQYFQERRRKREPLEIHEAFEEEEKRLAPVLKNGDFKNEIFIHSTYKSRGRYKEQLERYLNYFPRQQILVICSESFFSDPNATLRQVFQFVGVDPNFTVNNLTPRNVGRGKTDVPSDVYDYLNSYFLPHNQALYDLVGENYGW